MAIGESSILVGKSYHTADGEIRRVTAIDSAGDVAFEAISAPRGPGMMLHGKAQRLPLRDFAKHVEGEVVP